MTEPTENSIREVLRRLSDRSREAAAPAAMESTLVDAFRTHHKARERKRRLQWIPIAIAASLLIAVAVQLLPLGASQQTKISAVPSVAPVTVPGPSAVVAGAAVDSHDQRKPNKGAGMARASAAKRKRQVGDAPSLQNVAVQIPATKAMVPDDPRPEAPREFIEIPYAPDFSAADGGQVVRVNLRGASVRRLGFPVLTDRVQADVLLGHDGVARAIRVVSDSGLNSNR